MRGKQVPDLGVLIGRAVALAISYDARIALKGKCILVTGAGGSIGSELCRQLAACDPEFLYTLDHDESSLHRLSLELSGNPLTDDGSLVLADIRDQDRITQVFAELRPEIVFHAAALKHLAFIERNPGEAVKSNVFGTRNVIDAASRHLTEKFILISTDKAADPTSILGATKRLAEIIVRGYPDSAMARASVRFGNVLGSRGALLDVVHAQLSQGRPLTLTHPDASRFFMTVGEAVKLILEAGRLAEKGEVFVLDMGRAVPIVDVVRRYAERLGAMEFEMEFSGLRAGEKLHETLFSTYEKASRTDVDGVLMAVPPEKPLDVGRVDELRAVTATSDRDAVRRALARLVTEYTP